MTQVLQHALQPYTFEMWLHHLLAIREYNIFFFTWNWHFYVRNDAKSILKTTSWKVAFFAQMCILFFQENHFRIISTLYLYLKNSYYKRWLSFSFITFPFSSVLTSNKRVTCFDAFYVMETSANCHILLKSCRLNLQRICFSKKVLNEYETATIV